MNRATPGGAGMNFHYARLAGEIENKIMNGVYKPGEKLPSIRKMRAHTGLSVSTVYQAYIELEKRGVVEPRPKSGFYVKGILYSLLPPPVLRRHEAVPQKVSLNSMTESIVNAMRDPSLLHLGGATPAPELLPYKRLFRSIKSGPANLIKDGFSNYENPVGSIHLRREIAKRTLDPARKAGVEEIIITNGCQEAVNLCLRAAARPGDAIVVESPTFGSFLQIIEDQNMLALEVPADPETGVDLALLKRALDKNDVKACIFNPTFQNPMGFVMPPAEKKRLVDLVTGRRIPIIEDDIYGDLYFGNTRPPTLKSFDKKGLVLYCNSFSKTVAPGLRVGWTLPGRWTDAVKRLKLNLSIASPTLSQHIISEYLASGSYDRHLRRLKNALKNQVSNIALAVARHFPPDTKITAPRGGMVLWVQLNPRVDGLDVFHQALEKKIAIIPGVVFSTTGKFKNFIRLGCGHPWSDDIENAIAELGKIVLERRKGK
ncbi:MAG: PLP-dependent aminotransferase family protein [Desulfobacterales bacterium]|nr:PLP-dependent aminotransferase family protein [Desulfobacterales bacterium]